MIRVAPGEYGELLVKGGALLDGEDALSVGPAEVVGLLEAMLQRPGLQPQCRNYTLTALMKLSTRFPDQADRIKVCLILVLGCVSLAYGLRIQNLEGTREVCCRCWCAWQAIGRVHVMLAWLLLMSC